MEIKRQLHPSAVIPVRLNGKVVGGDITYNILAFIMLYLSVFFVGLILFSFTGEDFETTLGAVVTTLGNVGPGFGKVGPSHNFAEISIYGKWLLSGLMIMGRLELFTILMLFSPSYWKKY